jgi:hypothetical protein
MTETTPLRCQVARKDHECTLCFQKIPKGHRYWREYTETADRKEHMNCEEYRNGQPMEQPDE